MSHLFGSDDTKGAPVSACYFLPCELREVSSRWTPLLIHYVFFYHNRNSFNSIRTFHLGSFLLTHVNKPLLSLWGLSPTCWKVTGLRNYMEKQEHPKTTIVTLWFPACYPNSPQQLWEVQEQLPERNQIQPYWRFHRSQPEADKHVPPKSTTNHWLEDLALLRTPEEGLKLQQASWPAANHGKPATNEGIMQPWRNNLNNSLHAHHLKLCSIL